MLVVSEIIGNSEGIVKSMLKRNIDIKPQLEKIIELDEKRRSTQASLDNLLAESNQIAKGIGKLFKEGLVEKASNLKEKAALLKVDSKNLSALLNSYVSELKVLLLDIPNIPHDLVPKGSSENDNIEILREGEIPR